MKHSPDTLKPDELRARLVKMANELGVMAVNLGLTVPRDIEELGALSSDDVRLVWLTNNPTPQALEVRLEQEQDKLINQFLATGTTRPDSNDPSS